MKFDFEKENFVKSLQEILLDYGRMILHDTKKCYALWLDYAPRLEAEGALLRAFLGLDLGVQVTELKGRSDADKEAWRKKAVDNMAQSGVERKDAECLVDAVLETLGLGVIKEVPKQEPAKPEPPKPVPLKPEPPKPEPTKPVPPKPEPTPKQYSRFGPEEKIVYLNKHLPKIIGYRVAIIPNNISDWQSLGKYTADYGKGFQMVSSGVKHLGISESDILLGMVIEAGIFKRAGWALIFSNEYIYQMGGDDSWKLRYKEIERVEVQNNIISIYRTSGERKNIVPFRLDYNTQAVFAVLQAFVEGEKRKVETIGTNSQVIESPAKQEQSPYYVKAHNLQPGDALLCRTSSALRADNYMRECTYISTARKLLVRGKSTNGGMLYVEIVPGCMGWVSAFDVKKC